MTGRGMTTISLPAIDRDEINSVADAKGLKALNVPRLLLEGWRLLSPDQVAEAMRRFEQRRAGRRMKDAVPA